MAAPPKTPKTVVEIEARKPDGDAFAFDVEESRRLAATAIGRAVAFTAPKGGRFAEPLL